MKYYFKNVSDGYFTDGIAGMKPGDVVEIEQGRETEKIDQAWRGGGLQRSENKPENTAITPLLADKQPTIVTVKAKTAK